MLSRYLFGTSFVAFLLGFTSFAWLEATPRSPWPYAPFPSPGSDVGLSGYAGRSGPYALTVELPGSQAARERVLAGDEPLLPCLIVISSQSGGKAVVLGRTRLRAWTTAEDNLISYTSDDFSLPEGEFSLRIHNEGCAAGYAFQGGVASLFYRGAPQITLRMYLGVLPYLLGVVGVAALILASILKLATGARVRRPARK